MKNHSSPVSRQIVFSCRPTVRRFARLPAPRHESPTLAGVAAGFAFVGLCAVLVLVLLSM